MHPALKPYLSVLVFLRETLGPDYEIALSDVSDEGRLVAIENGYISGRSIGAPLTDTAKKFIEDKVYQNKDYISSYLGFSSGGNRLRSSTYFIKDEQNELVGLLCINFDDSRYLMTINRIMHLCHPEEYLQRNTSASFAPSMLLGEGNHHGAEHFVGSVDDALNDIIHQTLALKATPVDRMTQEERLEVIDQLNTRGVFYIKGAVNLVAEALHSSEATIYRYLSKINKQG